MTLLLAEGDGLIAMILIILFIMFGIPVVLLIIGIALRTKKPKTSKVLIIISVVYAIIGLGICGAMYV